MVSDGVMLTYDEDRIQVAPSFLNRWGVPPKCCVVDASMLFTWTDNGRRKAPSLSSSRPSNRRTKRSRVACGKLRRLDRVSNFIQTRMLGGPSLRGRANCNPCLARAESGRVCLPRSFHFAIYETPWAYFFRDLHTKRYRNLPWGVST